MPQVLPSRRAPTARVVKVPRGSPRDRGYDSRWDRTSADHRRRFPFCIWCEQEGRLTYCDVVDHKHPIADGGAMYDPANRWGLCTRHHGVKGAMEAYARRHGQIVLLPLWCDDPAKRPARFRTALSLPR